jgi:putative membrane protein
MLQNGDVFPSLTFARVGGGEIHSPGDLAGGFGVILFHRGSRPCPRERLSTQDSERTQMITTNLLLWIHIVALVAAGSNTVVMPIIGATLSKVDEQTRATLFRIGFHMGTIGKVAAATLLISGPLLLWLKYGGLLGVTPWFWAKMVLIVVMFGAIVFEEINFKKSASGDQAAARNSKLGGIVATVAFLGVLLAAVFAFN